MAGVGGENLPAWTSNLASVDTDEGRVLLNLRRSSETWEGSFRVGGGIGGRRYSGIWRGGGAECARGIRLGSGPSGTQVFRANDQRVRFWPECMLSGYNLSAMTEEDALKLNREHEGRLCVRLYLREYVTVLTQDGPIGAKREVGTVGGIDRMGC
jgi:hypothetical protein